MAASNSKLQPAIEYLSTFAVALLLLALVIAIAGISLYGNTGSQSPVRSSCSISAQLTCFQFQIASNGIVGSAVIVFTNNLGVTIHFPSVNSLKISPTGSQTTYVGNCYPFNAVPGATVTCNATLSGYTPSIGTQVEPTFQIKYSQCTGCTQFNTSGSGTVYVSPPVALYSVQLQSSSGAGSISVDGVPYPVGTVLKFIKGATYTIFGGPPFGYAFSGWTTSGGTTVGNPSNLETSAVATGSGNVIMQFLLITSTTVSCPTFTAGGITTCTATVTGSNPGGTVSITTSDPLTGSFTSDPCTLFAGSCTVTYTDSAAGTPTITATYSGDGYNAGSSGTTTVAVTQTYSTTTVMYSTTTMPYSTTTALPYSTTTVLYSTTTVVPQGGTWTLETVTGSFCNGVNTNGGSYSVFGQQGTYNNGAYQTFQAECAQGGAGQCTWGSWTTVASGSCNWDPALGSDPQGKNPGDLTCDSNGAQIVVSCACGGCTWNPVPTITLSCPTTTPTYDQNNQCTATTSIGTDEVFICMEAGTTLGPSQCIHSIPGYTNSGTNYEVSESEGTTTYNTQSLAAGTYTLVACDETFYDGWNPTDPCSSTILTITVSSPPSYSTTTVMSYSTTTVGFWTGAVVGCQASPYNHCSSYGPGSTEEPTGQDITISCTCSSGYNFINWQVSSESLPVGTCSVGNYDSSSTLVQCTGNGDSINFRCGCD